MTKSYLPTITFKTAAKACALIAGITSLTACMTFAEKQQSAMQGQWSLLSIDAIALIEPKQLNIATNGVISGNAGCNTFSGSIAPRGDHLNLSALSTTRMACKAEKMQQEQQFFAALERVEHFLLKGGQLILTDEQDKAVMIFDEQSL